MRLFFYGTLLDEEVRQAVLGNRAPESVEAAILEGWQRLTLAGASYPVIVPAAGERVDGVVARGLDRLALSRLGRYEGPEYVLAPLAVRLAASGRTLAVQGYRPRPGLRVIGHPGWDLDRWQRQVKPRFLARLRQGHTARAATRSAP